MPGIVSFCLKSKVNATYVREEVMTGNLKKKLIKGYNRCIPAFFTSQDIFQGNVLLKTCCLILYNQSTKKILKFTFSVGLN